MSKKFNQRLITDRREKSVNYYLDDIKDSVPLSKEQEKELSTRIKAGDEEAIHILVEANLKYVVTEAKKYQTGLIPLSELIAQANIGAIEAAKRFDGDKDRKFITYLKHWTKQSILQYISEYSRILRLPANKVALLNKIRKYKQLYYQEYGSFPTIEVIAEKLDVTTDKVYFLEKKLKTVVSIDNTLNNDSDTMVGSTIINEDAENPTEGLMQESLSINMARVIDKLNDRDREVIKMLFAIDYDVEFTLDEVGEKFGLTRERIRQIKEKALKRMKRLITENNVI